MNPIDPRIKSGVFLTFLCGILALIIVINLPKSFIYSFNYFVSTAVDYIASNSISVIIRLLRLFIVYGIPALLLYSILFWIFIFIYWHLVSFTTRRRQNNLLNAIKDTETKIQKIQELHLQGALTKIGSSTYESLMFSAYIENGDYDTAMAYLSEQKEIQAIKTNDIKPNIISIAPLIMMAVFTAVCNHLPIKNCRWLPTSRTRDDTETQLSVHNEACFLNNMILCCIRSGRFNEAAQHLDAFSMLISKNNSNSCYNYNVYALLNNLQHTDFFLTQGDCHNAAPYMQRLQAEQKLIKKLRLQFKLQLLEARADFYNGNTAEADYKLKTLVNRCPYPAVVNEAKFFMHEINAIK